MKNLKTLTLFIFAAILFSCSDSTDEELGLTGEGSLTAKIDGNDFASLKSTVAATVSNQVAAIQGSTSGGDYIRINIMNYTGVGTYNTGDAITNVNSISYGTISPITTWMSTFNIGNGTIKITEDTSTTMSGTFSFTGINSNAGNSTKTVTEGEFSAPKS
ncbi:DUF6252 family protein [Polaribacter sp. MSW13]|uniref:DUF6252 family protein n=1 Tax=Polaribacter marinus TaxID=2916838 RepID=A0A9X2AK57_9FLAO|nr:DUF6252 family protein [Polaribacter marinus]MCI2229722.1 DUF6252 family protein [Polaribacter marinus]